MPTSKFMQTLTVEIYMQLQQIAEGRGITVQELIRAVVVPDWLNGRTLGDANQRTK
jgi:predicted DNA-binding ribbon-helix-helix protein